MLLFQITVSIEVLLSLYRKFISRPLKKKCKFEFTFSFCSLPVLLQTKYVQNPLLHLFSTAIPCWN